MKNRKKSLINPDLIEGIWSVSDYYGSHGNGFVVQHNTCYGGHGQIGGLSEPCYICSKIKNQDSYYIMYTSDTRHEEVYIFEVGNSHRITVAEVDRIAKHVFECEDNDFDAANKIATILWYFDVSGNK